MAGANGGRELWRTCGLSVTQDARDGSGYLDCFILVRRHCLGVGGRVRSDVWYPRVGAMCKAPSTKHVQAATYIKRASRDTLLSSTHILTTNDPHDNSTKYHSESLPLFCPYRWRWRCAKSPGISPCCAFLEWRFRFSVEWRADPHADVRSPESAATPRHRRCPEQGRLLRKPARQRGESPPHHTAHFACH